MAPTNLTAKISYDAIGNAATTTDARGFATSNFWSVTRHLLATAFPATPQGIPVVTNTYDGRDWLTSTRNPLNKTTYFTNDVAQRLIATTDPMQRSSFFAYDNDGRQTNAIDAALNKTAQFWSTRGNLLKTVDAATNVTGKAYDGAGNLIYLTNRDGKVWQFKYDGANRLTNTISPLTHAFSQTYSDRGLLQSTTDSLSRTTSFGYDARQRLATNADSLGTNTYQYDGNNNLTQLTDGSGSKLSWVYDAYNRPSSFTNVAGYAIQYSYDNNGNLTNLVYPGNRSVKYFYDSNNRLTNVIDSANRQTSYTYDLAGHMTSLVRPNSTLRAMAYDDDGELTNIVEKTTSQFPIAFYTLHYSPAGRIDWEFKGPPPTNFVPPTRTMTFDDDNCLATFNGSSVTADGGEKMTHGPGTNNTFITYGYDRRDRLTNAGPISYAYDLANTRTSVSDGTNTAYYVTEPKSSQVLMRIKGTSTNYYIYGAGLLYEIDETAGATNTAFYHFDVRGSTVTLTDSNGTPTDIVEYSPYGTNDTPFLYNGQYGVQTDGNGLLYMRARYYNPYISRFISPDPSGFGGGLNFYAFCNGNPVNLSDPFGLDVAGNASSYSWVGQIYQTSSGYLPSGAYSYYNGTGAVNDLFAQTANMGTLVANSVDAAGSFLQAILGTVNTAVNDLAYHLGVDPNALAMLPGMGVLNEIGAAETTAADSPMITVMGSGRDVAPYVGQPGFNTFTGAGIPAAVLDTQNALWLNSAIQRGDQIWLLTDPEAHAALLQSLPGQPQSAYLNLELPMLNQYSGVNAIPKFAPPATAGIP